MSFVSYYCRGFLIHSDYPPQRFVRFFSVLVGNEKKDTRHNKRFSSVKTLKLCCEWGKKYWDNCILLTCLYTRESLLVNEKNWRKWMKSYSTKHESKIVKIRWQSFSNFPHHKNVIFHAVWLWAFSKAFKVEAFWDLCFGKLFFMIHELEIRVGIEENWFWLRIKLESVLLQFQRHNPWIRPQSIKTFSSFVLDILAKINQWVQVKRKCELPKEFSFIYSR